MSKISDVFKKLLGDEAQASPRPPVRAVPEPGDVVRMYLPTKENPNRPGPHLAFGIVVQAKNLPNGEPSLRVVPAEYGQRLTGSENEFSLLDKTAAIAAGLAQPATFNLARCVTTGWNAKWSAPGQPALVGKLADRDYDRFLEPYHAWRKHKFMEAKMNEQPAAKPAPRSDRENEISRLIRNRGQEREIWA